MIIGYIRVSSDSQNLARQEELMKDLKADKVFQDVQSGKDAERKGLQAMLNYVREGDTVVVESISRLGRSTKDLLAIVDYLKDKKVFLKSVKENFDTNTPSGKLVFTIFAAIAEMERGYIKDRQLEGIAIKKANGGYHGRVPVKVDDKEFQKQVALWKSGKITAVEVMKRLNLKHTTFYRRVKKLESK